MDRTILYQMMAKTVESPCTQKNQFDTEYISTIRYFRDKRLDIFYLTFSCVSDVASFIIDMCS